MSLSDEEWSRVSALLETSMARTGRRQISARRVLEGILWILDNKEKWQHLPATFPAQQTCYNRWLSWRKSGVMDIVLQMLGRDVSEPL